jgi:hypothetical protein
LANGQHEEYSFVRGRDADKNPSPPIVLRRRLETKAILSIAAQLPCWPSPGASESRNVILPPEQVKAIIAEAQRQSLPGFFAALSEGRFTQEREGLSR